MGTAGTALYADDTACDVRDEFVHLLANLRDADRATQMIVANWRAQIDDVDDGPVFWLALAETQWKYGCLAQAVKARAVAIIDGEADLHRWTGTDLKRRRASLAALKVKLLSEQPTARIPKKPKAVAVPSTKVPSSDGRAVATAYALASSPNPNEPRTQVLVEMLSSGSRGGGGIFLASCEYTEIELDWIDSETLRVSYPADSLVHSKSESSFYFGRTIRIVYRARAA